MTNTTVISLGGSIISPKELDIPFLKGFKNVIEGYLKGDSSRRVIIVTGGGAPARIYQAAYRELAEKPDDRSLDWIGIAATRLNGQLIKALFGPHCSDPLVTDPEGNFDCTGSVLTAAGWKPGFSSDYDAVVLAVRFGADRVFNLSNIPWVYTADPKEDPDALPIERIDWRGFAKIVGTTWTPGKNLPFDPIAAQLADKEKIKVIIAAGRDLENLRSLLLGGAFKGTLIEN